MLRNVSSFFPLCLRATKEVSFFFKFFEFCLSSALLAGKLALAPKRSTQTLLFDDHHRRKKVSIPRLFVFWAFFLFCFGQPRARKKNICERERESARQKRAVVFDERDDENDDDDDDDDVLFDGPKGVSVRLAFFFFATKEDEDEEGGTIARFFYVRMRFRATSFFSLVFSLSLSLERWN